MGVFDVLGNLVTHPIDSVEAAVTGDDKKLDCIAAGDETADIYKFCHNVPDPKLLVLFSGNLSAVGNYTHIMPVGVDRAVSVHVLRSEGAPQMVRTIAHRWAIDPTDLKTVNGNPSSGISHDAYTAQAPHKDLPVMRRASLRYSPVDFVAKAVEDINTNLNTDTANVWASAAVRGAYAVVSTASSVVEAFGAAGPSTAILISYAFGSILTNGFSPSHFTDPPLDLNERQPNGSINESADIRRIEKNILGDSPIGAEFANTTLRIPGVFRNGIAASDFGKGGSGAAMGVAVASDSEIRVYTLARIPVGGFIYSQELPPTPTTVISTAGTKYASFTFALSPNSMCRSPGMVAAMSVQSTGLNYICTHILTYVLIGKGDSTITEVDAEIDITNPAFTDLPNVYPFVPPKAADPPPPVTPGDGDETDATPPSAETLAEAYNRGFEDGQSRLGQATDAPDDDSYQIIGVSLSYSGNALVAVLAKTIEIHATKFGGTDAIPPVNLSDNSFKEYIQKTAIASKIHNFRVIVYVLGTKTLTFTSDQTERVEYKWIPVRNEKFTYSGPTNSSRYGVSSQGMFASPNTETRFFRYNYADISNTGRRIVILTGVSGGQYATSTITVSYEIHTFVSTTEVSIVSGNELIDTNSGVIGDGHWRISKHTARLSNPVDIPVYANLSPVVTGVRFLDLPGIHVGFDVMVDGVGAIRNATPQFGLGSDMVAIHLDAEIPFDRELFADRKFDFHKYIVQSFENTRSGFPTFDASNNQFSMRGLTGVAVHPDTFGDYPPVESGPIIGPGFQNF